jgi:hypothetical protein
MTFERRSAREAAKIKAQPGAKTKLANKNRKTAATTGCFL